MFSALVLIEHDYQVRRDDLLTLRYPANGGYCLHSAYLLIPPAPVPLHDVPARPGRGRPVSRLRSRSSLAVRSRLSMTSTSSGEISASTLRRRPPSESALA